MTDFKFKKVNPFKVPKGYFDQLEEQLLHGSDSVSKLNPFSVPEKYFDDLEKRLLQQPITKVTTNKPALPIFYSAVAAVAAILVLVLITSKQPAAELEREQAFNEFIESYYIEDFDSYEVYSMLRDSEIETSINQIFEP